ncbi:MAG: hypothetical protein K0Q97_431 [Bacillota bacterium]|jgi:hypothetical protein|nr:hypothetical protein [Bacillota bacterium]
MKKILFLFIAAAVILGPTQNAYAANMVSNMAVTKGGQSVAECAKDMDKGISECVKAVECAK